MVLQGVKTHSSSARQFFTKILTRKVAAIIILVVINSFLAQVEVTTASEVSSIRGRIIQSNSVVARNITHQMHRITNRGHLTTEQKDTSMLGVISGLQKGMQPPMK